MKRERMESKQQRTDMHVEEKSFECKGKHWHGEQEKKNWFSTASNSQKISGRYSTHKNGWAW